MTVPMMRTYGFDDLDLGQASSLMRTVMETDIVGFAQVSGDNNPIHLSDDYAASTRFGHVYGQSDFGGDRHANAGSGRGLSVANLALSWPGQDRRCGDSQCGSR